MDVPCRPAPPKKAFVSLIDTRIARFSTVVRKTSHAICEMESALRQSAIYPGNLLPSEIDGLAAIQAGNHVSPVGMPFLVSFT